MHGHCTAARSPAPTLTKALTGKWSTAPWSPLSAKDLARADVPRHPAGHPWGHCEVQCQGELLFADKGPVWLLAPWGPLPSPALPWCLTWAAALWAWREGPGEGILCPELKGEGGFWDPHCFLLQCGMKLSWFKLDQPGALRLQWALASPGRGWGGRWWVPAVPHPHNRLTHNFSCPFFLILILHSLPSSCCYFFPPTNS